ncbi:hypothetical protein CTEN210_03535 [Chaetoceros tenuissimus]|uniref:Leucine-rich repeat domain-containing protein n=1 Tax=Chaetoceros tenuissimus TaxID=426638 RepID=A0AAD3H1M9_9STRA|nr:hypothetical protein CTEN210_03535 [Chaetoceros tenuissimus]
MKLQRKLTNKEWEEIVKEGPGVRNYRGKKTLFYNGEELWDEDTYESLVHDREERLSWKVIIILPGVEVVPDHTFYYCENLETVIMADSVKIIEEKAFCCCDSLKFVKLSRNLEYIRYAAFSNCTCLTSMFIPPSCREIGDHAFDECHQLIIFHVPQATDLGENVIANTKLIEASHFEEDELQLDFFGEYQNNEEVNAWIKNMNGDDDEYALHRACSSFNPIIDIIYGIVKRQGLRSFKKENEIGITPLKYLEKNTFVDINEQKLVNRYILELMGETI